MGGAVTRRLAGLIVTGILFGFGLPPLALMICKILRVNCNFGLEH
jgi:hypothetical protein